jgi:hypothetical protein
VRADRQLVAVAMAAIIDDTEAIARRMREIKQEDAPADPDRHTYVYLAATEVLDQIARMYHVMPRLHGETDQSFRPRILERIKTGEPPAAPVTVRV